MPKHCPVFYRTGRSIIIPVMDIPNAINENANSNELSIFILLLFRCQFLLPLSTICPILDIQAPARAEYLRKELIYMGKQHSSGDTGFCHYVGHSGSIILNWDDDTVVSVECGFGNHETCRYANKCELYQRRPVGFVQTYPLKNESVQ